MWGPQGPCWYQGCPFWGDLHPWDQLVASRIPLAQQAGGQAGRQAGRRGVVGAPAPLDSQTRTPHGRATPDLTQLGAFSVGVDGPTRGQQDSEHCAASHQHAVSDTGSGSGSGSARPGSWGRAGTPGTGHPSEPGVPHAAPGPEPRPPLSHDSDLLPSARQRRKTFEELAPRRPDPPFQSPGSRWRNRPRRAPGGGVRAPRTCPHLPTGGAHA